MQTPIWIIEMQIQMLPVRAEPEDLTYEMPPPKLERRVLVSIRVKIRIWEEAPRRSSHNLVLGSMGTLKIKFFMETVSLMQILVLHTKEYEMAEIILQVRRQAEVLIYRDQLQRELM